jgi:hypothetical protein
MRGKARPALWVTAAVAAIFGCTEDGVTPACPDLTLYDVRDPDAAAAPDVIAEREEAARRGCITLAGSAGRVRDAAADTSVDPGSAGSAGSAAAGAGGS